MKKPYQRYKDSGVEWIGEIPHEWYPCRLKYVTNKITDGTHITPTYVDKGIPFLRVTDIQSNTINLESAKRIPESEHADLIRRCYPETNDLLLSKNGTIGITKIIDWDWDFSIFVSLCLIKFKLNKLLPQYFTYIFQSNIADEQISGSSKKTSVTNLHLDKIRELVFLIPTIYEQQHIANYLDRKTKQIDTLINRKKRLIDLLKEERGSVINEAVTKGIDPDVSMKDSGIEWLGDIPEHWATVKLKWCCSLLKDGTHLPPPRVEKGIPLLSVRNIVNNKFVRLDDDSMISEEDFTKLNNSFQVNGNDVLLAIVGATMGKVAIVPKMDSFTIQRSLAFFRVKSSILNFEYFFFFLQSATFQNLLWNNVAYSAQPGIYLGSLANFKTTVPLLGEQDNIVQYIKEETTRIDTIITKASKEIKLLNEYRTALISEVVTGKIDVRDWKEAS